MSSNVGMSSCCLSGSVHNGTPSGRVEKVGELDTYIAEPESKSKAKTIIFLVDIFGFEFNNTRLLADNYAKQGFYVYVPDILKGDPLPISFLNNVEPPLKDQEQAGLIDKAKNTAIVAGTLGTWLPKHTEATVKPIIDDFIKHVRSVPGTSKIGTIGFCFGGRYAILTAHDGPTSVDAAYACHPSLVAIPGDFDPVTKPLSLAVGTKDSLLDDKSNDQIKDILDKKSSPTELVKYEDQIHGFALRSDWSSDKDKKAMDDAEKQGVAWFNKYLS
ncbi:hypothetical protein Dsin_033016 [Dipteronia sinensis]|uniref:Dienelactone hydrolase domain-containing protein n=1 Tax=Dipteronia sinensis TaxID=43782 RepID=A0AAD9ZET2_9ROSI|nr:hypothetical protein Dsin_033016 [Dipteronia sinensis]